MSKNQAVFGIYPNRELVEEAVDRLRAAGFRHTDISVLLPTNAGTKDFAHEKGTKAPEGIAAGASSGAVIGGALGWLAGIGTLAIPGLGPFIAAGPILAALAGAGAGGALGGVLGALIGLGIPEYEAKRYEGRIRKGGILVSVHCDNSKWAEHARKVLEQTGAEDISTASEGKADYATADRPASRRPPTLEPTRPDIAYEKRLVRDVMSKDVAIVEADSSLREAAKRMESSNVGFVLVTSNDKVVGLLTDRDVTVRGVSAGQDPNETSVRAAMTTEFVYCHENDEIEKALDVLRKNQVQRLPVLDREQRVVGIVSLQDLAATGGVRRAGAARKAASH